MKKILFLGLLLSLSLQSCKKGCTDENALNYEPKARKDDGTCILPKAATQLSIKFMLTQKFTPFAIEQVITTPDNYKVKVNMLKFYACDFKLYKEDNTAVNFAEVVLIDLDLTEPTSPTIIKFPDNVMAEINSAKYTKLSFGLGLNPTLNASDPVTFENSHPMSVNPNMYWSWATKYIFAKFEGRIDSAGNGTFDKSFFYHTGLDQLYRMVEIPNLNLFVESEKLTELTIGVDFNEIFYPTRANADSINFFTQGQSHTTDNLPVATLFVDNFSRSFKKLE